MSAYNAEVVHFQYKAYFFFSFIHICRGIKVNTTINHGKYQMASTYPIIKENPIKSNQKTATICTVEP